MIYTTNNKIRVSKNVIIAGSIGIVATAAAAVIFLRPDIYDYLTDKPLTPHDITKKEALKTNFGGRLKYYEPIECYIILFDSQEDEPLSKKYDGDNKNFITFKHSFFECNYPDVDMNHIIKSKYKNIEIDEFPFIYINMSSSKIVYIFLDEIAANAFYQINQVDRAKQPSVQPRVQPMEYAELTEDEATKKQRLKIHFNLDDYTYKFCNLIYYNNDEKVKYVKMYDIHQNSITLNNTSLEVTYLYNDKATLKEFTLGTFGYKTVNIVTFTDDKNKKYPFIYIVIDGNNNTKWFIFFNKYAADSFYLSQAKRTGGIKLSRNKSSRN